MELSEERLLAYRRIMTIIAVVVLLFISFLIIKPFLIAIISAAVLAYLFYPCYRYLKNMLPAFISKENTAALLTVLFIVLIVIVPMLMVTIPLTIELKEGYLYLKGVVQDPHFNFDLPSQLSAQLGNVPQYKEIFLNFTGQLITWFQKVLTAIPNVMLNLFLTIFSIFFFLKGGRSIYNFCQEFLPLPEKRYQQIFARFDELSRGMVMGQILVGLLQGFLAWGAFTLLGVPNPVLWGSLTAIISIIPLLGAAMVWLPVDVYLLVKGYFTGELWKGIVLFIFGVLVISTVDNVLKPKIVGDHANIHPLIILFGVLGGIHLMGIPGLLIGPLVLALFDVVLSIFREVV